MRGAIPLFRSRRRRRRARSRNRAIDLQCGCASRLQLHLCTRTEDASKPGCSIGVDCGPRDTANGSAWIRPLGRSSATFSTAALRLVQTFSTFRRAGPAASLLVAGGNTGGSGRRPRPLVIARSHRAGTFSRLARARFTARRGAAGSCRRACRPAIVSSRECRKATSPTRCTMRAARGAGRSLCAARA